MAKGAYDWDKAHEQRGKGVYYASRDKDDVPGVIAIHPDLLNVPGGLTQQQYSLLLDSMAQVAQFTRKAIAWPSVPCALPWILGPEESAKVESLLANQPGSVKDKGGLEWLAYVANITSLDLKWNNRTLMCTAKYHLAPGCLVGGVGLTPLEFEHIKTRYRLWRPYDASPEKVLLVKGKASPDYTKKLLWQEPQELTYYDLLKQVARLNHLEGSYTLEPHTAYSMHVIYIGQAMKVIYSSTDPSSQVFHTLPSQNELPAYQKMFDGHNWERYAKSLPDKSPKALEQLFQAFRGKCVVPPSTPAAVAL